MSSKNWTIKLTHQAEKDLRFWRKTNPQTFKRCLRVLQELELNPTNLETIGRPEWLKGKLSGCMSRRITLVDRCVYQVLRNEKIIKVLQLRFHYDDH